MSSEVFKMFVLESNMVYVMEWFVVSTQFKDKLKAQLYTGVVGTLEYKRY